DEAIEEIGEKIEKIKEVDSMNFTSKNDERERLINSFGDEGEACGLFEQDNPLNHAYVIKTKERRDTEKVASEIEEFDNVQKVIYGKDVVPQLFKFNTYDRNIGLVVIAGLVFTAMFLISNPIKLLII